MDMACGKHGKGNKVEVTVEKPEGRRKASITGSRIPLK
jgi:hypothetical protein